MSKGGLTPKQEVFAQRVADGMSQADAYRNAFNVKETTKPETCQSNASRLMTNALVLARVKELQEKLASKHLWTREKSVEALKKAMLIAEGRENSTGVVAAVKELNAMHGFNLSKIEVTGKDGESLNNGVLLVPSTMTVDDWEKSLCKK